MTIVLMFHIFLAITLVTVSCAMVGAGLLRRSLENIQLMAFLSLGATFLSGTGLLVLGASLGHFCASMTLVAVAMFAARSFYLMRLPSAE